MSKVLLPKWAHPDFTFPGNKPAGSVVADRGRLVIPFNRSAVDIVSNAKGTLFGTAELTARGMYRSGSGYTSGYATYANDDSVWAQGAITVFGVVDIVGAAYSGGNSWNVIFEKSFTSAAEPYYVIQISTLPTTSSTTIRMQWNNSGTRNLATGTVSIGQGRYTIVGVVESGRQVLRFYDMQGNLVDGISATQSGAPTNYNTTFKLSSSVASSLSGFRDQRYELAGVDCRAWSDQEIEAFSKDPFRYVLSPEIPQSILIPAAAGAYTLTADPGTFTLTGTAANLEYNRVLTADPGSLTLAGVNANLEFHRTLAADPGALTLAGVNANLEFHRTLTADPGALTFAGTDATLTYNPAGSYTLTADPGAFTFTGTDANLEFHRTLTADPGALTFTGTDASLNYGYTLTADPGALTFTGTAASFLIGYNLTADAGALTFTGTDATLTYSAAGGAAVYCEYFVIMSDNDVVVQATMSDDNYDVLAPIEC